MYQAEFPGLVAQSGYVLNHRVAWLYDQFIRGTLTNYDYDDNDPNPFNPGDPGIRLLDAGALQYAIWELGAQDTTGAMFNPSPSKTDFWKSLAIANAAPGNHYGVEIIDPYLGAARAGGATYFQAVLVKFVPAPGAGAAMALVGLLAGRRRR